MWNTQQCNEKRWQIQINKNCIGKGLNFTNNDCETLNSVMKREDIFKLITLGLEFSYDKGYVIC